MVERRRSALKLEHQLIRVAPEPVLPRLEGTDDGMLRCAVVLGGVLIFRVVTATYVAAGHTEAQVDPPVTHPQAFLTAVTRRAHRLDLVEVGAVLSHRLSLADLRM